MKNLADAKGYRASMLVTEMMVYSNDYGYYVCPRCHVTLDREFVNYCDRCGQHLSWNGYKKTKIIYSGNRKDVHTR